MPGKVSKPAAPAPVYFAAPADFRAWLERNHATCQELLVGFYKRDSGRPSITWPESVDQALCFGWIDGVRRSIDAFSYSIRFTPRKPTSNWSAINIGRVEELLAQGLMRPTGIQAFEARLAHKSAIYAYEQRAAAAFDPASERRFRANRKAWNYFQSQPPWYRRTAAYWVISARREETRDRRLAALIADSEHERPIKPLTRRGAAGA